MTVACCFRTKGGEKLNLKLNKDNYFYACNISTKRARSQSKEDQGSINPETFMQNTIDGMVIRLIRQMSWSSNLVLRRSGEGSGAEKQRFHFTFEHTGRKRDKERQRETYMSYNRASMLVLVVNDHISTVLPSRSISLFFVV